MSSSTAAATSGPARQPRPASSAPATQRTPSARSCWTSRRPGRLALRRGLVAVDDLSGTASAVALEEADAIRGPVRGEGGADDPGTRDGSPEAAVVGLPTVVAHHEPMTGGNLDRHREVAAAPEAARTRVGDIGVALALAVAVDVPVAHGDRVARRPDDALDEVHVRARPGRAAARFALRARGVAAGVAVGTGGRVEDKDVADLGIAEAVAQAVD